ncbi:hypothetical protein CC86DRAFT_372999 [Ophiobolus disseminans]|uniref:F-box domain-containing protein n=1 Tax=Ophiobolus disseminans TaxID=1469910 RepID=A0A6A6ZN45_9PLEO|nr:hypothetical protein CC86DRAFT_372999 [Ophiobolus disseminans]
MVQFEQQDFPPLPTRNHASAKCKDDVADPQIPSSVGTFATINDLPDELILGILQYVPGIDVERFQLVSLVNLSRTNRYFHGLVADKLYASYNSHFCEPYLFCRTVISNKNVAELVRHVDITYGDYGEIHDQERKRYIPTAQDKKIVKEGLKAIGTPDWKMWATDCNTPRIEVEILHMVILMQMPNVSSIKIRDGRISTNSGYKTPKWIDFIKRANPGMSLGSMHRFENLKSLSVDVDQLTLNRLTPIFRIVTLRNLHLKGLLELDYRNEHGAEDLRYIIPQGCNNLDELVLENTFLQLDVLEIVVASAKHLKFIRIKLVLDDLDFDFSDELAIGSSTQLATALRSQEDSLESLSVITDFPAEISCYDAFKLYGGLQDFVKLRYLRCPLDSIADFNFGAWSMPLAPHLHILHIDIRKANIKCLRAVEEMADAHTTNAPPSLEMIRITGKYAKSSFTYDWSRLVQSLSQTDIDLVIGEVPHDEEGSGDQWEDDESSAILSADETSSHSSDEVSLYSHSDEEL